MFLYLHRIDVGFKYYFIYVNTFTENTLKRGCFGMIELESFALYMSHLVQRVHVHLFKTDYNHTSVFEWKAV